MSARNHKILPPLPSNLLFTGPRPLALQTRHLEFGTNFSLAKIMLANILLYFFSAACRFHSVT